MSIQATTRASRSSYDITRFNVFNFFNINTPFFWLAIVALHLAIAFIEVRFFRPILLLHIAVAFGVGMVVMLAPKIPAIYSMYPAAYIMMVEVFWRAEAAPIFWETGKYAILLFLGGTWVLKIRDKKMPMSAFLYTALLLPAAIGVVAVATSLDDIHKPLSRSMTGPAALVVSVLFFYGQKIKYKELLYLLVVMSLPAFTQVALSLNRFARGSVVWTGDSNNEASGGYASNQVSSLFGLAWLSLAIFILFYNKNSIIKFIVAIFMFWLIGHNIVTFSRGGLFTSIVALGILFLHSLKLRSARNGMAAIVILLLLLSYPAYNYLDNLTDGLLTQRFTSSDPSSRDTVYEAELDVFYAFPLTGAGADVSTIIRRNSVTATDLGNHTEYTRLLADHGIAGGLAGVMMVAMVLINYFDDKRTLLERGFVLALGIWALVYMTHSATRTVAPSFLLGMIFAYYEMTPAKEQDD